MSRSISLECAKELFNYNYWARDRHLKACAALTGEQFLRPLGGSFPSVRDTLGHLLLVEWVWLERWQGRSPKVFPSHSDFPNLEAVSQRWSEIERDMRAYLDTLTDAGLERPITYVNRKGEQFTYALWRIMMHVINHQSYHRGQVTNYLRLLGAHPPELDFLVAQDAGIHP